MLRLLCTLITVAASGVEPGTLPLDEVLERAEVVFEGRVLSLQEVDEADAVRRHYQVSLVDNPDVLARLQYREPSSPAAVTGSGAEGSVSVGERYLFVARTTPGARGELELLRVEPTERQDDVYGRWRMVQWRRMGKSIELPPADEEPEAAP